MDVLTQFIVFTLDDLRLGLELSCVDRVIPIIETKPLPKAPEIITGVINLHGKIIPVADIRKRIGLTPKATDLNDKLIIANTSKRKIAVIADSVGSVVDALERDITPAQDVLPGLSHVEGIIRLNDGIVLIHNLDKFLSIEEEAMLNEAIEKQ